MPKGIAGFQKGHPMFAGGERGWFKKGQVPWNKGRTHSKETRRKIAEARRGCIPWNKGKKDPKESLAKMGKGNPMYGKKAWNSGRSSEQDKRILAGERSPSWQGGLTERNWGLRWASKYLKTKRKVYMRDGRVCQICGRNTGPFQVDHIKPFSRFPELRMNLKNMRVVCKWCHLKTPTWGGRATHVYEEVVAYGE